MCAVVCSRSPGGARRPLFPLRTTSRLPFTRQATTGMPAAMGSRRPRAMPSFQERSTATEFAGYREDVSVLPVAGELGGGGDAELRCLSLVLRAERAVADQAEPRLRTHGADSGEDSQQVVMVLHRLEPSDAGNYAPGAGVPSSKPSETRHVDAVADQASPNAAPPANGLQVLAVLREEHVGEGRQRTLRRPREQPRGQPRALVEVEPM